MTFRAPSSLPISVRCLDRRPLAAHDDLARGVAVGDAEDAVRRGSLDKLREPRVVEADDRRHRAVAALARGLHEPAALADEADAVGEGDDAGCDERRVLAHRVAGGEDGRVRLGLEPGVARAMR
jgi:hypothetical protein